MKKFFLIIGLINNAILFSEPVTLKRRDIAFCLGQEIVKPHFIGSCLVGAVTSFFCCPQSTAGATCCCCGTTLCTCCFIDIGINYTRSNKKELIILQPKKED